jgi:hypothetical protein
MLEPSHQPHADALNKGEFRRRGCGLFARELPVQILTIIRKHLRHFARHMWLLNTKTPINGGKWSGKPATKTYHSHTSQAEGCPVTEL